MTSRCCWLTQPASATRTNCRGCDSDGIGFRLSEAEFIQAGLLHPSHGFSGLRGSAIARVIRAPVHVRPVAQWPVHIDAHHPAYLTWEEFVSNQARLRQNWNREGSRGVARGSTTISSSIESDDRNLGER